MNNAHRDDQHCRRADLVRHSKIVTQIATARISIAAAITHAPFGPRTGMFFGGTAMLPDARTFDTRYRLNTWTLGPAGSLINKTHVWNDDDNLTNITNTPADANNRVFGYDEIHRLTIANGPWGSGGYSYDLNGNRLSKTEGALNATYLYTAGTNRLFSATSATTPGEAGTFSYAGRGSERNQNRVAHGNLSGNISGVDNPAFVLQPPGRGVRAPLFSYSQRDRFSGFDSGLSLAVGYAYTGDGARFKKEIEFVGQGRHNIPIQFFSASGKLLEEFNPAGAVSTNEDFRDYIWLPGTNENVAQIGTSGCVVGPCVDTLYFTHADHLGTPIAMTNTAGALVWRVEQRPFGGIFSQSVATITNNLRFPGQYYDFESGLAQNGFRDYSEKLGRYIEPDPIGASENANVYNYVNINPIVNTDKNGLYVVNNSPNTIYVKPELTGEAIGIPPGGVYTKDQDGFSIPCMRPGEAYKTPNQTNVIIGRNGKIDQYGSDQSGFKEWAARLLLSGWKGKDFLDKRHKQNPPDTGWDAIFASPANNCKPCPPK